MHHESITKSPSICKICDEINTKTRRLVKTRDNIARWGREPDKFSASLEKAEREGRELEDKIRELNLRRPSIATNINGGRSSGSSRAAPASANTTLPPLTSMAPTQTAGYEYSSTSGLNRRQETGVYSVPRTSPFPALGGANGLSVGAGQITSQYGGMPAAATFPALSTSMHSGGSGNVAVDRQRVYAARR